MYTCRGVLHTPRNVLRRRFASKTGCVFGVSLLERVKSGAFLTYSGAEIWNRAGFARTRVGAQKHTPRNVPRQRFGSKIEQVLGASLLEWVKSGAFLGASGCGNMKPDKFFTYPCRGVLHTPPNILRQGFASKTGRVLGASVWGNMKLDNFLGVPV